MPNLLWKSAAAWSPVFASWLDAGLWSMLTSQLTWHFGVFWSVCRLLGPGRPDCSGLDKKKEEIFQNKFEPGEQNAQHNFYLCYSHA